MIELRPGSPLAVPSSGPMPWVVRIVLRRTGWLGAGRLLPGLGGEHELARWTLQPEIVAQLGGPTLLPGAVEVDRRKYALGAIKAGYGTGWAVEVDVERGHRRTLWPVSTDPRTEPKTADSGGSD